MQNNNPFLEKIMPTTLKEVAEKTGLPINSVQMQDLKGTLQTKQQAANKLAAELDELADAVRKMLTDPAAKRLVESNIEHRNHSLSLGREELGIILSDEE